MNSKQINFFLSNEDLPEVNIFFLEKKCLIFKRDKENPEVFSNYNIVKNPENIFQVCVSKDEFKDKIFYEFIESKNYSVDILKSYCIEFTIGGIYPYSNKEFHSSRFYYITEYFDNDKTVRKDKEFINWADDIFKSFKKRFLKKESEYSNRFLTEKFIDWIRMNNAKITTDGTKFII